MHLIALTAADVTVLIDAGAGRLPALVYWGRALPDLDAEQAEALVATAEPVAGTNDPDIRPRVALLPGHDPGWTGRPGLGGR
jgi:alpha-galactosidase